jgi:flagellum-specific ATP synthase
VLVEADDMNDPIGDAVRGILDGHIWLSRKLANRGHFPAIDVLESVSRVMPNIIGPRHREMARELIGDLSRYRDCEDILQLGAYVRGTDPRTDLAVQRMPAIEKLLQQYPEEQASFDEAVSALEAIYANTGTGQPAVAASTTPAGLPPLPTRGSATVPQAERNRS